MVVGLNYFIGAWMQEKLILIIDVEATCEQGEAVSVDDMEIIEIGAVLAQYDGTIQQEFASFIRPVIHPHLSAFCRRLTGIEQRDVDSAPVLSKVMGNFSTFIQTCYPHNQERVWGSWGKFDCKQLALECERNTIENPLANFFHINLKRQFAKNRKIKEVGMAKALELAKLPLNGEHHRGLSDARNIAALIPWSLHSAT